MTNYKRNFFMLLLMAILACISLSYYAYNQSTEIGTLVAQKAALTDTLTIYKTKQGKNAGYTSIFKGTKSDVLAALKQTDPKLYEVVKSTSGIKSVTNLKTVFRTDTLVKVDTLFLPGLEQPTQKVFMEKTINNEYYTAHVTLNGDSLGLGLKVLDEFTITNKEKSNGWFKPKSYVVDVVNKNPYTVVTGLKSFEITPKSNKGIKISIGLLAAAGAYLLLK